MTPTMTARLIIFAVIFSVIVFSEGNIRLSLESAALLQTHLLRSSSNELRSYLNHIVDKVIDELRPYIISGGYDPVKVSDIHKNFSWGIIYGKLELENGTLLNLSTMHRIGEIKMKIHEKERYMALSVPIGFNDLRYICNYTAKVWKIGPSGDLKSKVTDIKTNTTLNMHLSSHVITLNNFNITKTGAITVRFSESSMDWILNLVSKYTLPYLHDRIVNTVQDAMNDFINSTLIRDIYI